MVKAKQEKTSGTVVDVIEAKRGIITVCVLGRTPLICNRVSEKAKRELLYPKTKTAADKTANLKHDPLAEYRDSPYRNLVDGPTRLQALSTWFKGAMKNAALDLPGLKKAEIGRWVYTMGDRIDLYGTPQLFMSVTRSSGFPPAPDVRTRAILPRWGCRLEIAYNIPLLREKAVVNLAAAGGVFAGVGDWRVQKGSGSYGQYDLVDPDNPEFLSILGEGREAQDAALATPACYDDETQSLFEWFKVEVEKRGPDSIPTDKKRGDAIAA